MLGLLVSQLAWGRMEAEEPFVSIAGMLGFGLGQAAYYEGSVAGRGRLGWKGEAGLVLLATSPLLQKQGAGRSY